MKHQSTVKFFTVVYSIKIPGGCIYFRECRWMEMETAHASPKRQWTRDYVEGKKGQAWFWSTCPTGRSNGFAQVLHGPSNIIVLHMLCPLSHDNLRYGSRQYSRIIVFSKAPLPNYRSDLDDKRPQREVCWIANCPSSLKIEVCMTCAFVGWNICFIGIYTFWLAKRSWCIACRLSCAEENRQWELS